MDNPKVDFWWMSRIAFSREAGRMSVEINLIVGEGLPSDISSSTLKLPSGRMRFDIHNDSFSIYWSSPVSRCSLSEWLRQCSRMRRIWRASFSKYN